STPLGVSSSVLGSLFGFSAGFSSLLGSSALAAGLTGSFAFSSSALAVSCMATAGFSAGPEHPPRHTAAPAKNRLSGSGRTNVMLLSPQGLQGQSGVTNH